MENHVLIVERSILSKLRNEKFYSLKELNDAISPLLEDLNNKDFSAKDGSRRSVFFELDKPVLRPLPIERYEYAYWKKPRFKNNYHVVTDYKWYSVPFQYIGKTVDLRITNKTVEIFYQGVRITSHPLGRVRSQYSTDKSHMPPNHKYYLNKWDEERIMKRAKKIGEYT